jgi:hypothetical protein
MQEENLKLHFMIAESAGISGGKSVSYLAGSK